ncbi:unnamed protein product [Effrenium voratum]|uniref:Phytanoyl-CoA dioxygenase n=1 Tax=Effrenium voratum TaxID=2562239 RepID=A0AA36NGK1_9DINO|nr:unnamed protein product [Effrenium voratum]CAJ1434517.1 unnamed protein product [Effrenium voratum]
MVLLADDFEAGAEACKRFDQDGFCIFESFLRPLHLEQLRGSFDERLRDLLADNLEVDLGVNWAADTAEPFLRTLQDERLLDFLVELCGLPLVAMRLELFEKRPGSQNVIPWHQDTYTTHVGFSWTAEAAERAERPHPVTLWVALDAACRETGGMEMVPGRHRELLGAAVPLASIANASAHSDCVEYKLLPGQAGVHHPLTPHRSLANTSTQTRRAFLVRLVPWSPTLEERCDALGEVGQEWVSQPTGKYVWRPGTSAAVAPDRALNRLLVLMPRS